MKDKTTAGLLAIFLGVFGAHKFYLDNSSTGFVYLALGLCTGISMIIGWVEGIRFLVMSKAEFDANFNPRYGLGSNPLALANSRQQSAQHTQQQVAQHVVVNIPGMVGATAGGAGGLPVAASSSQPSVADELKKLNDLRVAGAITEEEFVAHKRRMLS